MRVKNLSQVILDISRHADEDAPLEKQESATNETGSEDFQRGNGESRPTNLRPVLINSFADNDRYRKIKDDPGKNARDAGNQRDFVRQKISGKFSQVVHEQAGTRLRKPPLKESAMMRDFSFGRQKGFDIEVEWVTRSRDG